MNVEWIVTSCVLIVMVVLIRFLFQRKISLRVRYGLWAVVALRLLIPFSFSGTALSVLNLLPEPGGTEVSQGGTLSENIGQGRYAAGEKPGSDEQQGYEVEGSPESGEYDPDSQAGAVEWLSGGNAEILPGEGLSLTARQDSRKTDAWEIGDGSFGEKAFPGGETSSGADRVNAETVLRCLWLFGAGLFGVVLLAVNLDYSRRLRRGRRKIAAEQLPWKSSLPVYTAEIIQTPCLFGLLHPAVYVTEAVTEEEKTLAYVLCHEETHYGHRDNWWALVRALCFCLHWYNPLVWLAVYLSRQDGELACDERALELLGEKERADYGRAILSLCAVKSSGISGWQLSTTMSGSKRQLKERLQMIAERPGKTVSALVLLLVLVAVILAVTFTGKDEEQGANISAKGGSEAVWFRDEGKGPAVQNTGSEGRETTASIQAGEPEDKGMTAAAVSGENGESEEQVPAEDSGNENNSRFFCYNTYTGYLDECSSWADKDGFVNLDLDGDGLTDRVWRENIENRSRADYRIDFGNGDVAELYGMGGGIPQVRTLDVNGDGQAEILFTLSYGYSADPRAFGENALLMKGEDGVYKPVALPESMVPMDTGAAGGSGVREGYQWSLLLEGVPAGETSLKLTCVNSSDGAGLEVVKSYTKEEWEAVNDSVFASKAESLFETPAYQADIERDVLSGKDILKLHYSALGKESSDEVILTLEYEDGRMRMSRLQYLEYYREKVPITIGEKEYELWIDGHGLTDSGYYEIDFIALVDPENPGGYADTIIPEEVSRISWQTPEGEEAYPVQSTSRDGGIIVADLNFDGFEDLCFQGWVTAGANVPYYCMLWNRSNQEFEYSATLCNVDTDAEERWISSWSRVGWDQYYTAYYRYDEDNRLHLVRYVEENFSEDEVFEKLDLTYVEDDGVYSLPMIWENSYDIHDGEMCWKMIAMAKQALEELYLWTGDKVDTVCFKVTKIGCVYFATSPENMGHARIFSSRYFGADTEYNLSNSETSISGISMISEREVWYSPVSWRIYPEELSAMSDEDIIVWYFERVHAEEGDKVETITERRYEDVRAVWVIQTEGGDWYEVVYNAELREISDITGPYSSCPEH